jgi:uncharacterized membrane protein YqaE (UPF0057 family)
MLRKFAAVILAVGLCLPYSCDVRPITGAWESLPVVLFVGLPVLAVVAYVLHNFVPPLAAFHERHGRGLHAMLRLLYFVVAGAYLANAVTKNADWPGLIAVAGALVVTGVILIWQQGRGTKATRVPLLLLLCAGVPAIAYAVALRADLKIGAGVFLGGWLLGVFAEIQVLKVQPAIAHGG